VLTQALLAALALGFFGSLHCVAMCGPLCATAAAPLPYFVGRWTSYAFAGALFGWLGARAAELGPLQSVLAIGVAALLFAKGVSCWIPRRQALSKLGQRTPAGLLPRGALALGLVTGALPCGLLAGGWAIAASTARPLDGALVMTAFSAATAPALLAGRLLGRKLVGARWAGAWQGALFCALAVWIAARPLFIFLGGHACH
jgi:sulfite exporter TauE/SafE